MQENKNTTLSFARIGTLLLFSIVLITTSFLVVYTFLSSQQTQEVQPPIYQQIVPSIIQQAPKTQPLSITNRSFISYSNYDNWKMKSIDFLLYKYPREWEEIMPEEGGGTLIRPINPNNKISVIVSDSTSFSTDFNAPKTPESVSNQELGDETAFLKKQIIVDGHKAIYQEVHRPYPNCNDIVIYIGDVKSIAHFQPKDGGDRLTSGVHTVRMCLENLSYVETNRKILDQILSTFKYTR